MKSDPGLRGDREVPEERMLQWLADIEEGLADESSQRRSAAINSFIAWQKVERRRVRAAMEAAHGPLDKRRRPKRVLQMLLNVLLRERACR